jgi:hypothetical protein
MRVSGSGHAWFANGRLGGSGRIRSWADVTTALRALIKRPAFALTAIGTLALGIGATAAIFSVVNAVLLEPLPYSDPSRLVHIWSDMRNRNVTDFPWPPADFHDLRQQATTFESVAAISPGCQVIAGVNGAEAEHLRTGNAVGIRRSLRSRRLPDCCR